VAWGGTDQLPERLKAATEIVAWSVLSSIY
jgi:hypothetical protein